MIDEIEELIRQLDREADGSPSTLRMVCQEDCVRVRLGRYTFEDICALFALPEDDIERLDAYGNLQPEQVVKMKPGDSLKLYSLNGTRSFIYWTVWWKKR